MKYLLGFLVRRFHQNLYWLGVIANALFWLAVFRVQDWYDGMRFRIAR